MRAVDGGLLMVSSAVLAMTSRWCPTRSGTGGSEGRVLFYLQRGMNKPRLMAEIAPYLGPFGLLFIGYVRAYTIRGLRVVWVNNPKTVPSVM